MTSISKTNNSVAAALIGALVLHGAADVLAQARTARRGGSVKTEEGGAARGPRGAAVKTDEGAAAVTRHGAAVKTEEGVKTASRHGGTIDGEEANVAVGRRGAVVVGEEGAAAVGRGGYRGGAVVYEDNDAWKTAAGVAAGVAAGIAIGTMLRKPPGAGHACRRQRNDLSLRQRHLLSKVMSGGEVVYQVVEPPPGAIITTLPAGCTAANVGRVAYSKCGTTHYQKVSAGYRSWC